jgi:hypothetical protein
MQTTTIPADEQDGALSSFWTMLQICESRADNDNYPLLKHWVAQWYEQWNRITGDSKVPRWFSRKDHSSAENNSTEVVFTTNLDALHEATLEIERLNAIIGNSNTKLLFKSA